MTGATERIEAAIKSHPLCAQIVLFLIEHERAMDTVHGVAKCWVNSDELAVKSALDTLVAVGVIVSQSLSSGTYYSLTPDVKLRAWLKAKRASLQPARPAALGEANAAAMRCGTDHQVVAPLFETGA